MTAKSKSLLPSDACCKVEWPRKLLAARVQRSTQSLSSLTLALLQKNSGAMTLPCFAPGLCSDAHPHFKAVLFSSGRV